MAYKEAIKELLNVAGDYMSISNTHSMEETLYKRNVVQLREEIDKIIEDISLAPQAIKIYVDEGTLIVEAFDHKSRTWGSFYDTGLLATTKEEFIDYLDGAFRDYLNKYAYYYDLKMKDVHRFCGYANLILGRITPEIVDSLNSLGKELKKANKALTDETENYANYYSNLKKAMHNAAEFWLFETSIEPNMKLSIKDLRVIEGRTDIRVVKKVKNSSGSLSIFFNETSSAIRGKERIDAFESWLLNNPQFLEMSKVLKDPRLDKIY